MKKKLTLTIEESVTERAKRLAREKGTSVSEIVEDFLKEKTRQEAEWQPEKGTWTSRLLGSVRLPEEYESLNYKQIKMKEILKKYGS